MQFRLFRVLPGIPNRGGNELVDTLTVAAVAALKDEARYRDEIADLHSEHMDDSARALNPSSVLGERPARSSGNRTMRRHDVSQ